MRLARLAGALVLAAIGGAASPVAAGHSCTPGPYVIFFDRDSSAIKKDAVEVLNIAIENQGFCGSMAALMGHSDTSEKPAIAYDRALAVSNYLASRGVFVKPGNIVALGATQPRIKTPPATEERQNRRVEMMYGP
jgi:outer membrane protein OmpA-like peptidoglycan-associated protein